MFRSVRGSLRLDRGSGGGAEGQVHNDLHQHRSISARTRLRLTDASVRTEKSSEGGGEAGSKMLGLYGQHVLSENGKRLQSLAEYNKLALLNTFLQPPKWRTLHLPKRQPQQGESTFGLYPDKAGEPMVGSATLRSIGPLWRHQNRVIIAYARKSVSHAGPHQIGGRGRVRNTL